jgi:hypothetical protein
MPKPPTRKPPPPVPLDDDFCSMQPGYQGDVDGVALDVGIDGIQRSDEKLHKDSLVLGYEGDVDGEGLELGDEGGTAAIEMEGNVVPEQGEFADEGVEVGEAAGEMEMEGNWVPDAGEDFDGEELGEVDGAFEMVDGRQAAVEGDGSDDRKAIDPTKVFDLFVARCGRGTVPFDERAVSRAVERGDIGANDARFLRKLIARQAEDEAAEKEFTAASYAYHYFLSLRKGKFLEGRRGASLFHYMTGTLGLRNHPFGLRIQRASLPAIDVQNAVIDEVILRDLKVRGDIRLKNSVIVKSLYLTDTSVLEGSVDEARARVGLGLYEHNLKIPRGSLIQHSVVVGLDTADERDRRWGVVDQGNMLIGENLVQEDFTCRSLAQQNIAVAGDFRHSNTDAESLSQRDIRVGGYYTSHPQAIGVVRRIKVEDKEFDWSTESSGAEGEETGVAAKAAAPSFDDGVAAIDIGDVSADAPDDFLVSHEDALRGGTRSMDDFMPGAAASKSSLPPPVPTGGFSPTVPPPGPPPPPRAVKTSAPPPPPQAATKATVPPPIPGAAKKKWD